MLMMVMTMMCCDLRELAQPQLKAHHHMRRTIQRCIMADAPQSCITQRRYWWPGETASRHHPRVAAANTKKIRRHRILLGISVVGHDYCDTSEPTSPNT